MNTVMFLAAIAIGTAFPGGNAVVESVDQAAGMVRLRPDERGSKGWFYTYFSVTGAEGRVVKFLYEPGRERMTKVGPAVSSDSGKTWRFLNADKADAAADSFVYSFGAEEREVRFSIGIPYVESDWKNFLGRYRGNPRLHEETLCWSERGRDVELLRIPATGQARYAFFFTCRHHACEMSASRVLEGYVEEVLSDSPAAKWIAANADVFVVPFVDKDGVEEGEQGKARLPHDHNQDYIKGRYNSVRAIIDLVRRESRGRQFVFADNHAPWIRGNEHDHFYFLKPQNHALDAAFDRFDAAFTAFHAKARLRYEPRWNIAGGAPWNNAADYDRKGLRMSNHWAELEPNCVNAFCLEVGYGLCGGVYSEEGAREIGRDVLKALVSALTRGL